MKAPAWDAIQRLVLTAFLCVLVASPVHANMATEPIVLKNGPATIKGSIKGDETIDYRFDAQAGQTLKVVLKTTNGANNFNVLREGNGAAIFIGNVDGASFEGKLPETGAYLIRVYLMRSAARRAEKADFTLTAELSTAPDQIASIPNFADGLTGGPDVWEVASSASVNDRMLRNEPRTDARGIVTLAAGAKLKNRGCRMNGGVKWCEVEEEAGAKLRGWIPGAALIEAAETVAVPLPTKFVASAQVRCSAGTPPALSLPPLDQTCEIRVVRRSDEVELWLLKPGTTSAGRFLSFSQGAFKSDDDSEVTWLRSDDNWVISVKGDEFYFFPDALLTGG
jgi:hypothetical protein